MTHSHPKQRNICHLFSSRLSLVFVLVPLSVWSITVYLSSVSFHVLLKALSFPSRHDEIHFEACALLSLGSCSQASRGSMHTASTKTCISYLQIVGFNGIIWSTGLFVEVVSSLGVNVWFHIFTVGSTPLSVLHAKMPSKCKHLSAACRVCKHKKKELERKNKIRINQ